MYLTDVIAQIANAGGYDADNIDDNIGHTTAFYRLTYPDRIALL